MGEGEACTIDSSLSNKSCSHEDMHQKLITHLEALAASVDINLPRAMPWNPNDYWSGTKSVVLNIGSFIDPPIPDFFELEFENSNSIEGSSQHLKQYRLRSDIRVVAYEPVPSIFQQIKVKPWLSVVPAAVSNESKVAFIRRYNEDKEGISSSLAEISSPTLFPGKERSS